MISFDDLTRVYQQETTMDCLSVISPSFYDDCAALASRIRTEREQCKDYKEQDRLVDLLKNIHIQVEGVWEKRLGNIVSGLGLGVPENMTPVELEAFDAMSAELAVLHEATVGRLEGAYRGGKT